MGTSADWEKGIEHVPVQSLEHPPKFFYQFCIIAPFYVFLQNRNRIPKITNWKREISARDAGKTYVVEYFFECVTSKKTERILQPFSVITLP